MIAFACKRCQKRRLLTRQHQDHLAKLNASSDPSTSHSLEGTEVVVMKEKKDSHLFSTPYSTSQLASTNAGSKSPSGPSIPRKKPLLPKLSFKRSQKKPQESKPKVPPKVPTKQPPTPPPKLVSSGPLLQSSTNQTDPKDEITITSSSSVQCAETKERMNLKMVNYMDEPASMPQVAVYCYSDEDNTISEPPLGSTLKPSPLLKSMQPQKSRPKPPPKLLSKQPPNPPPKILTPGSSLLPLTSEIDSQGHFSVSTSTVTDATKVLVETNTKETHSKVKLSSEFEHSTGSNSGDDGYVKALYPCKQPLFQNVTDNSLLSLPVLSQTQPLPNKQSKVVSVGSSSALLSSQTYSQDNHPREDYPEPVISPATFEVQPLESNLDGQTNPTGIRHSYADVIIFTHAKPDIVSHYQPLLTHFSSDADKADYVNVSGYNPQ